LYTDEPTEVKIGLFVISFYSISEQTMVIICILPTYSILYPMSQKRSFSCITSGKINQFELVSLDIAEEMLILSKLSVD